MGIFHQILAAESVAGMNDHRNAVSARQTIKGKITLVARINGWYPGNTFKP